MKEYYCLLLNNCYDLGTYWVCPNRFSMAPDILEKDLTDLYLLEQEFMDLDDMIIENEDSYHVLGGFPIFGEIKEDGKMHDVITGNIIEKAIFPEKSSGLSYKNKYKADSQMVEEMLTLIGQDEKVRYENYLENLAEYSRQVFYGIDKTESYMTLKLKNAPLSPEPVIAKKVNGVVIDAISRERIYPTIKENVITSRLTAAADTVKQVSSSSAISYQVELVIAGTEEYRKYIETAKTNTTCAYNSYKRYEAKRKVR